MIHNPWTIAMGYASDFRKAADMLDKYGATIKGVYAKRTGKKDEEIQTLLDAETYMTGQEAVDMGFADAVEAEKKVAACLKGDVLNIGGQEFNISRYSNIAAKVISYEPAPPPEEAKPDHTTQEMQIAENKIFSNSLS